MYIFIHLQLQKTKTAYHTSVHRGWLIWSTWFLMHHTQVKTSELYNSWGKGATCSIIVRKIKANTQCGFFNCNERPYAIVALYVSGT